MLCATCILRKEVITVHIASQSLTLHCSTALRYISVKKKHGTKHVYKCVTLYIVEWKKRCYLWFLSARELSYANAYNKGIEERRKNLQNTLNENITFSMAGTFKWVIYYFLVNWIFRVKRTKYLLYARRVGSRFIII